MNSINVKVNSCGDEFIILDSFRDKNRGYSIVRFLSTNNVDTFRSDQVASGEIKDRMKASVLGVGSIGNVKKVNYPKEYSIWYNILNRCYNVNSESYAQYGENGVKVHRRWLVFENFVRDIPKIDGYNHEKFHNNELELDKDKKQFGQKNKIYSLETCTFITKLENFMYREMLNRDTEIIGISPDGEHLPIKSVMLFAKERGMNRGHIYECVNGIRKTHKKWRFYKVGATNNDNSISCS